MGIRSETAIVYFEQGHEWLFGDPARLLRPPHPPQQQQPPQATTTNPAIWPPRAAASPSLMNPIAAWDRVFHRVMGLPVVLATVSESARGILGSEFGRGKALLVPNGVDARGAYRPLGRWADGGWMLSIGTPVILSPCPCNVMTRQGMGALFRRLSS